MPRKAKPTKHSSAELNKRAAASLVSDYPQGFDRRKLRN